MMKRNPAFFIDFLTYQKAKKAILYGNRNAHQESILMKKSEIHMKYNIIFNLFQLAFENKTKWSVFIKEGFL